MASKFSSNLEKYQKIFEWKKKKEKTIFGWYPNSLLLYIRYCTTIINHVTNEHFTNVCRRLQEYLLNIRLKYMYMLTNNVLVVSQAYFK